MGKTEAYTDPFSVEWLKRLRSGCRLEGISIFEHNINLLIGEVEIHVYKEIEFHGRVERLAVLSTDYRERTADDFRLCALIGRSVEDAGFEHGGLRLRFAEGHSVLVTIPADSENFEVSVAGLGTGLY